MIFNSNLEEGESLYLFKNGKAEYIPLSKSTISEKDSLGALMSNEEINIYQYLINENNFNPSYSKGVNLYNELQQAGYSVIKMSSRIGSEQKIINCLLSRKATKEDMKNLYEILSILEKNINKDKDIIDLYIYKDEPTNDYHYYSTQIDRKNFKAKEVLKCHIKNKLNMLDEEEKEMFKLYENFDMEKILCMDVKNYIVNHTGAGIIVYSDHGYIARNLTRMTHDYDLEAAVRQLCPELKFTHKDVEEDFFFFQKHNISFTKLAYGSALTFIGKNPNKKQIENIRKTNEKISEIIEKNGSLFVAMSICEEAVEKFNLEENEIYDINKILAVIEDIEKQTKKKIEKKEPQKVLVKK